jgi:hypothetical protein
MGICVAEREFERFFNANDDQQERMIDEIFNKCRAGASRDCGRGLPVDSRLLVFSIMLEACVVLGCSVGEAA